MPDHSDEGGSGRWQPAGLDGAESRAIAGGYRLWCWRPPGVGPDTRPPVLWVLDGASLFASVARAVALLSRREDATGVRPILVAGIDHDPVDRARRDIDYGFGPCRDPAGLADRGSIGKGAEMLGRITGPMDAALSRRAPFDPRRQAILGHSLAGLFALHALAANSPFRVAGAISPSIWWNRDVVRDALTTMPDRGQCLFIGAGEREAPVHVETDAERRRDARGVVREAVAMAGLARARLSKERVALHIAPDEDHASTPLALLPRFLRFASAGLEVDPTE